MSTQLQRVAFHNQQITVLVKESKFYVAMKPICENIGLDWHAQRQRIDRHHILKLGKVMITSPTNSGYQEYTCLPLSMLNGWLLGIDINRVKPEIRESLEQYQLEAFDVLYCHFMPKIAKNNYPNTQQLEKMLQNAVDQIQGKNLDPNVAKLIKEVIKLRDILSYEIYNQLRPFKSQLMDSIYNRIDDAAIYAFSVKNHYRIACD